MPINAKKTVDAGYNPRKRAPRMRATNDLYTDELNERRVVAEAMLAKEKGLKFWHTGGKNKRPPAPDEFYCVWLVASKSLEQAKRQKCEPVIVDGKQEEYGDLRLYMMPAVEAWNRRNAPAQEALDQFDDVTEGRDAKYGVVDAEGNVHKPVLAE